MYHICFAHLCRCALEYTGPTCNEYIGDEVGEEDNNALLIALPVVGGVLAIILAVILFCVCKERHQKRLRKSAHAQYREYVKSTILNTV